MVIKMIRFECDYAEGAHENVLKRLVETNMESTETYSEDAYCARARELIKKELGDQGSNADIHFLVGGTQTNLTVISAALRAHECVVAAKTGHVNVHETGAIEATGHKVYTLDTPDGKLTAQMVKKTFLDHKNDESYEHIAKPKLVYISNPTELGTTYDKAELEALYGVCRESDMLLYMDGARLGCALTLDGCDLTLEDCARLTDVFFIGGTKHGALFGEAVVITRDELKKDFRFIIKQKGGMLAKGRLLGLQFEALFTDGLYYKLARHSVDMAMLIKAAFIAKGFELVAPNGTNQQFVKMPYDKMDALKRDFAFATIDRTHEDYAVLRFCTSWATKREDVDTLVKAIMLL